MSALPERPWPTELKVSRAEKSLTVSFDNGETYVLPAEYVRVMTGSALDRGHGEGDRPPVSGKRDIGIVELVPIGRYAVRIKFDDGHDTGLYSWDRLYELGHDQPRLWGQHLAELQKHGLSR